MINMIIFSVWITGICSDDPRDIADPWYTGGFDGTYSDVVEGCEAFLEYLKDKKKL